MKSVKNDTRGRFVIVEALVQESPVLLINIYAPNKTNEAVDFYEDLRSTLLESDYDQDHKFIIGGDFNVPLSLALDSNGSKTEKKDVVKKIHDLMLDFNLIDIWRLRNPDKKRFTWKQKNPFIQRRLDYWLISDEFQDNVDNTDIISAIKTDHAAIFLQIDSIEKQPTGPSYWKLNSSLLDDQKYIELIKDNIPLWLIEFKDVSDKRVLWDLIKYKIRQVSMKYSKTKAKERRNHLSEIEKKLKERQESFGSSFLLQCNFKSSNLPSKLPIFYKECLEAWSDFNAHTPTTKQEVLNEIIWNNQNLLINKQSIYNKKIKDAGFVKLSDILSNNSKLKSWEFFRKNNLSLSDYLLLLGVFSAIPPRWKLLLKNEGTCNIDPTDKTASKDTFQDISTMNSKSIYSAMIKLIQIPPTVQFKFNSLYNIPDILDWKNIYQLPGRVTLDTRTRAFQYKILNRILYTNRILCKMKLVSFSIMYFLWRSRGNS